MPFSAAVTPTTAGSPRLIYTLLTIPTKWPHVRKFRFGIPLLMKCSRLADSSESDALRYLNSTGLDLPIPRLIDSLRVDGQSYAIMTVIPGRSLFELICARGISRDQLPPLIDEVHAVIRKLWTLSPPPHLRGLFMCHPNGNGLPSWRDGYESTFGPDTLEEFYSHFTVDWTANDLLLEEPERMAKVMADRVAYVHCDLRCQNIMVTDDGKLSGIIDWENSGWHARHWQLLVVRTPYLRIHPPFITALWKAIKFEDDVEEAYEAGWELMQKRL